MKKPISFILIVCMMLAMMPMLSITASAAAATQVYVGGTDVAAGDVTYWLNDGLGGITGAGANDSNYNIKYDPNGGGTPILTLSGTEITKSYDKMGYKYGIYSDGDISIVVIGDNSIISESVSSIMSHSYGINVSGGAVISGSGKLTVTGGAAEGNFGGSFGMIVWGDLIISGVGTLNVNGGTSAKYASQGLSAHGQLTISNSIINAAGGQAGDASVGNASVGISGHSSLDIYNSIVNATGGQALYDSSYGIKMKGPAPQIISISGSAVTAKANTASVSAIAMSKAPTIGDDPYLVITASSSSDGSGAVDYNDDHYASYKYLRIEYAEAKPSATIDYTDEKLTGLIQGVGYTVNGENKTADANGKITVENSWFGNTISLVKKGVGLRVNSAVQSITLAARPATPTCTAIQPNATSATGTVSGISALMQYSTNGGSIWNEGTDNPVSGIAPGILLIRVKAKANTPASQNQTIIINPYNAPPTPPAPPVNTNTGGGGGSSTPVIVTKITSGENLTGTNVDNLVKEKKTLTVEGKAGEKLVFDTEALKNIDSQTKETVKVEIKDVSSEHKSEQPGKIVFSLKITAGGNHITSFGSGIATVSLPYELKSGEKAEDVTVWYLAEDGTMSEIPCTYDSKTKLATFKTNHFSLYVVGADSNTNKVSYQDVKEGNWFYDAVSYVVNNGLMKGTDDKNFNPHSNTTRGMVVTILWRMENSPAMEKEVSFVDVKKGKYYYDAVGWAASKGIVGGYSDSKFGADDMITRDQMASILYRYANYKKYNTKNGDANINGFSDYKKVPDYALNAMGWSVNAGLIKGSDQNLMPQGSATRAQVATILMRFNESYAK